MRLFADNYGTDPGDGARGAEVLRGLFLSRCARGRSVLQAALLGGCCMMSVGGVSVKKPVPVRIVFQS